MPNLLLLQELVEPLGTGNWYTKKEIVLKLNTSPRSVNRYLKILRNAGLFIGYKRGKYSVGSIEATASQIKSLLYITVGITITVRWLKDGLLIS